MSVILLGMVGVALMSGFAVAAKSQSIHRASAVNTVVVRNAAAALLATDYRPCGSVSGYNGSVSFTAPLGSTWSISKVELWTVGSNPAAFSVRSCSSTDPVGSATGDPGLQRITFSATSTVTGRAATRTRTVVKRFDGAYQEPATDPLPGGSICTISATSQVDTTWVDEFAGQQGTNHSSDDHMDILYLAGSRRYAYLHFNIAAGAQCDEGTTLPATADIKSARLRLYTYNIGGLPACGANSCWHALERVRSTWTASTLKWNNQPCPTGYAASCETGGAASPILFEHGTGALNWGARYQYIEHPRLLTDVRAFFTAPATNFGWVIKEACAETYGKACGDISPGFEFRAKSAAASERPSLELVYT